jgi:hypothetical protein
MCVQRRGGSKGAHRGLVHVALQRLAALSAPVGAKRARIERPPEVAAAQACTGTSRSECVDRIMRHRARGLRVRVDSAALVTALPHRWCPARDAPKSLNRLVMCCVALPRVGLKAVGCGKGRTGGGRRKGSCMQPLDQAFICYVSTRTGPLSRTCVCECVCLMNMCVLHMPCRRLCCRTSVVCLPWYPARYSHRHSLPKGRSSGSPVAKRTSASAPSMMTMVPQEPLTSLWPMTMTLSPRALGGSGVNTA